MYRLAPLLLVAALAALPARAQETPADPTALPTDTVAVDSVAVIEPDPARARDLYNEGVELLRANSDEEALLKFEEALVYNEAYPAAALGRGQALAKLRRLEDSRNAFESAIAMAEASDASNADQIAETAGRYLEQINQALETAAQREAESAQLQQQAAVTQKIEQAVQMLQGNEVDAATATEAYALLEQARLDGYDADQVAFYYAKALNAMDRGADAVPYAETAVAASEGEADRSPYYVQLGLAQLSAGNAEAARSAFEAIEEDDAWFSWKDYYLGQVDAEANGEG
jgi:tetratricopeptide (TPR) repeat protein